MMIVGNYIVEQCGYCGKYVRLNKWLLGSMHVCMTEEERAEVDRRRSFWAFPFQPTKEQAEAIQKQQELANDLFKPPPPERKR